MRNAIFPSFSSPFYGLGTNEAQTQNSNASMVEIERLNGYSGFYIDSQLSNDLQTFNYLAPLSSLEASQNHISGAGSVMPNSMDRNISHKDNSGGITPFEYALENARKRMTPYLIKNETTMKESKRRQGEDQGKHQLKAAEESSTTQKLKTPKRRSNGLGDRVTALQQLVSPFGKTDTASVLQEATAHINLLQEQIQVLTSPYFSVRSNLHLEGSGEEKANLRSRGLCLVPISSMLYLVKEGASDKQNPTGGSEISRS